LVILYGQSRAFLCSHGGTYNLNVDRIGVGGGDELTSRRVEEHSRCCVEAEGDQQKHWITMQGIRYSVSRLASR